MAALVRSAPRGDHKLERHLRLVGHVDRDAAAWGPPEKGRAGTGAKRSAGPARRGAPRRPRVAATALTLSAFGALWAGGSALRSAGRERIVPPAGARRVGAGYVYVVRPGDTVWSIATAMEPGTDPRPLVDEIEAEVPGGVLRVGEVLHLP